MIGVMSILGSFLIGAAAAEEAPALPKAAPPQFGVAVVDARGGLEINYAELAPVHETRERSVEKIVDGRPVVGRATYTVRMLVPKAATAKRAAGQYEVFRDGKRLDEPSRAALLRQPTRVVFTEKGSPQEPLDPFYLSFLRDDTVVVCITRLGVITEPGPKPPAPSPASPDLFAPPRPAPLPLLPRRS